MAIENSPQFSNVDLDKLSSNIRSAGKGNSSHKIRTHNRPPHIGRIHMAVEGGHITEEEGMDLNPKYDPKNRARNSMEASRVRRHENNTDEVRKQLREQYYRRKARRSGQNGGN